MHSWKYGRKIQSLFWMAVFVCLFFPSLSPLTLLLAHSYLRSVGSRGIYHLGIIKTKETKDDKEKRHLTCHPDLVFWSRGRHSRERKCSWWAAQHFRLHSISGCRPPEPRAFSLEGSVLHSALGGVKTNEWELVVLICAYHLECLSGHSIII